MVMKQGMRETLTSPITHFFVDELKLYVGTTNNLKKLLDIVTTFLKDIGMKFGVDVSALRLMQENKQTAKYPLKLTLSNL